MGSGTDVCVNAGLGFPKWKLALIHSSLLTWYVLRFFFPPAEFSPSLFRHPLFASFLFRTCYNILLPTALRWHTTEQTAAQSGWYREKSLYLCAWQLRNYLNNTSHLVYLSLLLCLSLNCILSFSELDRV